MYKSVQFQKYGIWWKKKFLKLLTCTNRSGCEINGVIHHQDLQRVLSSYFAIHIEKKKINEKHFRLSKYVNCRIVSTITNLFVLKYKNNEIQKQKYLFFIEVQHFEKQILITKRYERNDILYVKSHNITLVSG